MEDLHRELARIAFAAGGDLGLMLAGGYAIGAHGLTERPSGDLDLATSASLDLPTIVDRLSDAFRRSGFDVQLIESKPRMARLEVTRRAAVCEVDLLKEAVGPPVLFELGPVLTLDDAVGLKVRPLADRALHRDFIDVHAAATKAGYTWPDLERLGERHSPNWSLADLADRLSAIDLRDDTTFAAYGLTDDETTELRQWALAWAGDITVRSGDYTVRDADHWQLPQPAQPEGSARVLLGL